MTESDILRFWTRVNKDGPIPAHVPDLGKCWLWTGGKFRFGHGAFWLRGENVAASRASFEIHNGPIPEGIEALHKCDNPTCVNPSHIFGGTHADNMNDKCTKKRHPIGEKNGMVKINEADVIEIRRLRSDGVPGIKVAEMFGITPSGVYRVYRRKNWRHVL